MVTVGSDNITNQVTMAWVVLHIRNLWNGGGMPVDDIVVVVDAIHPLETCGSASAASGVSSGSEQSIDVSTAVIA